MSSLASRRLVVVAGLVRLGPGRVLVQRRPPGATHGAGMLELPGGKVELGEAPRSALARELEEEWGPAAADLVVEEIVEVLHHVYPEPDPEVLLLVYSVDASRWGEAWAGRIRPEAGIEPLAFRVEDLPVDEFLAADRGFIAALRRRRL